MNKKNRMMILIVLVISLCSIFVTAPLLRATGTTPDIITRKDIRLTMVNQEPDPVEPGEYVEVKFKVENWGSDPTGPLIVGIRPTSPFTLLSGYELEQEVSGLERRQMDNDGEILEWKLRVDKDAAEGDNELIVYLKELKGQQVKVTYEDTFYIDVRTSDTILDVKEITTEPEMVVPGQPAKLMITLQNLGDSFIKDVKVGLDLGGLDIATFGSTSEKIIQKMNGKEEVIVTFSIIPSASAELGIIKVPLNLSFKDNINNEYNQDATFGLPLMSLITYVLVMDDSEIKTANKAGEVTIKLSNPGVSDIKFLTTELKPSSEYEILSASKIYVGNVDSDDFESVTYKIYAKDGNGDEDKFITLRLLLTYMDVYNKEYSIEEEVSLPLFSKKTAIKYGLIAKPSYKGFVIMLLIVVGGVWYYFHRKKKKKQENSEKSKK